MIRAIYSKLNYRNYKGVSNTLKIALYCNNSNKLYFSSANQKDESITQAKSEARNYLQQENIKEEQQSIEAIDEAALLSRILKVNSTEKFEKFVVSNPKPVVLYCMSTWSQTAKDFLPKILDKFVFNNKEWDLAIYDIDHSPTHNILKIIIMDYKNVIFQQK